MGSHEDEDKFATALVLITTVPFGILFVLALICICASL